MWEALKKKSLSYDESFTSLSRRHNVSALNAEAEDAMPLLWGNVFEDSILSFKEFKTIEIAKPGFLNIYFHQLLEILLNIQKTVNLAYSPLALYAGGWLNF